MIVTILSGKCWVDVAPVAKRQYPNGAENVVVDELPRKRVRNSSMMSTWGSGASAASKLNRFSLIIDPTAHSPDPEFFAL